MAPFTVSLRNYMGQNDGPDHVISTDRLPMIPYSARVFSERSRGTGRGIGERYDVYGKRREILH